MRLLKTALSMLTEWPLFGALCLLLALIADISAILFVGAILVGGQELIRDAIAFTGVMSFLGILFSAIEWRRDIGSGANFMRLHLQFASWYLLSSVICVLAWKLLSLGNSMSWIGYPATLLTLLCWCLAWGGKEQ